ncbi:MAG: hypothetical protein KBD63_00680 [Bacteriovoracaceae bacterium]|nr:hypothetical protein [Bacteriovoracaceae bacterium]
MKDQNHTGVNMYRANSYNEDFSRIMQNMKARQGYLLELMNHEDPMSLEEALRFTISRLGLTEFAKLAHEKKQNVETFVSGKRKLKQSTLDKYLLPFGLKVVLKVEPIKQKKAA